MQNKTDSIDGNRSFAGLDEFLDMAENPIADNNIEIPPKEEKKENIPPVQEKVIPVEKVKKSIQKENNESAKEKELIKPEIVGKPKSTSEVRIHKNILVKDSEHRIIMDFARMMNMTYGEFVMFMFNRQKGEILEMISKRITGMK